MAMTTTNATPPKTKATNRKTAAALPPKALAWTQHFEGRNFGTQFELLSEFAKKACIQPELLKVDDHGKAMEILSKLSLTMTREDLKRHGSLKIGREREKRLAGYQPGDKERSDWLEMVSLIVSTGGPTLEKLLAAYGEHIEGVASRVYDPMRRIRFEQSPMPYSVATKYIYKANRRESKDYSWDAGYRLVNALNGCWLAHHCGIDPRHSAIYLINAVLVEIAVKNEKLPKAIRGMGRNLIKPNQSTRICIEHRDFVMEEDLCMSLSSATVYFLEGWIEAIY